MQPSQAGNGAACGGGHAPERVGLTHPRIAPYGAFTCADGRDTVISIQNERERADFCHRVLREPELLGDPHCASNAGRVAHRDWVDGRVAAVLGALTSGEVIDRLIHAQSAFGNLNSVHDLIEHPQLRTRRIPVGDRGVELPASPWVVDRDTETFAAAPSIDSHATAIRAGFAEPAAQHAATRCGFNRLERSPEHARPKQLSQPSSQMRRVIPRLADSLFVQAMPSLTIEATAASATTTSPRVGTQTACSLKSCRHPTQTLLERCADCSAWPGQRRNHTPKSMQR